MDDPEDDTAAECHDHPCCIRGFKRHFSAGAGWWHLRWREKESLWHVTDPDGREQDVDVPKGHPLPPSELVGRVKPDEVSFAEIEKAIISKPLWPIPNC
jgi:hypothetical protein